MADDGLGEIMASRTIDAVYPDGRRVAFRVQVGQPRPPTGQEEPWGCPCRIEGLDDSRARTIYGVDSLQALTLALEFLRRVLTAAASDDALTFHWGDEQALNVTDVLW
ncbi:DUF6968 family protein [Streptomyces sp. WG-D5]